MESHINHRIVEEQSINTEKNNSWRGYDIRRYISVLKNTGVKTMDSSLQAALISAIVTTIVGITGLISPLGKTIITRISDRNNNISKKETALIEQETKKQDSEIKKQDSDSKLLDNVIIQMLEDIKLLRQQLNDCYSGCQENIIKLTEMIGALRQEKK